VVPGVAAKMRRISSNLALSRSQEQQQQQQPHQLLLAPKLETCSAGMQEMPKAAENNAALLAVGAPQTLGPPQRTAVLAASAPAARRLAALKSDTASAAAVDDAGPTPPAAAGDGGVQLLQQTLHQHLQQLLLPDPGPLHAGPCGVRKCGRHLLGGHRKNCVFVQQLLKG
jgi:hypothetical protein